MRPIVLIAWALCVVQPRPARGQAITAEAAITGGYSTDEATAGAVQTRVFGDLPHGIRYFGEAAWAARSLSDAAHETDSFDAAYPYTNQVQIIEAYVERLFRPRGRIAGLRGGRFRTPFGIYNASDHAYSGFLRAPLVRYEEYAPIANTFLENGVDVVLGVPRFTVDAVLASPGDVGEVPRRSGIDAVVRVQGYYGPFIAGASYMSAPLSEPALVHDGRNDVAGIDLRWMHAGVQLRGEWITGRPYGAKKSTGWYADAIIHRTAMGPVTAVVRVERLDFGELETNADEYLSRQTIGVRVNVGGGVSVQLNALHQSGDDAYLPRAVDVAVTWSVRKP